MINNYYKNQVFIYDISISVKQLTRKADIFMDVKLLGLQLGFLKTSKYPFVVFGPMIYITLHITQNRLTSLYVCRKEELRYFTSSGN